MTRTALGQALRRIEADTPRGVRERVLAVLMEQLGADAAAFVSLVETDVGLRYCRSAAVGDTAAVRTWSTMEGQEKRDALWDPRGPRGVERERFVGLQRGPVSVSAALASPAGRAFYAPAGITDHARALLYDGPRFLGWLGLLRQGPRHFGRPQLARLNAARRDLAAAISAADAMEGLDGDELQALSIVPETLQVEMATEGARRWLQQRRGELLRDVVRAYRAGQAPSGVCVEGAEVRLAEIAGDAGARYIVTVRGLPAPRVNAGASLPPRLREVAELLARSATSREIAADLGLAPDTVRGYVKEIYRRLDVGSRVELAEALARMRRD